jgi:hypothetical protein
MSIHPDFKPRGIPIGAVHQDAIFAAMKDRPHAAFMDPKNIEDALLHNQHKHDCDEHGDAKATQSWRTRTASRHDVRS